MRRNFTWGLALLFLLTACSGSSPEPMPLDEGKINAAASKYQKQMQQIMAQMMMSAERPPLVPDMNDQQLRAFVDQQLGILRPIFQEAGGYDVFASCHSFGTQARQNTVALTGWGSLCRTLISSTRVQDKLVEWELMPEEFRVNPLP